MRPTRLGTVFSVLALPLFIGGRSTHGSDSTMLLRMSGDTVGCLDTLRPSDSISAVVKISVKPQDKRSRLPSDFEGLLAQEFRSRLKVPPTMALSVMHGWTGCDSIAARCASGALIVGSQVYATAHNDGTVSRIGVIDVTLTPGFADSVGTVIKRIGEEKLMPPFPKPDSIPLDITISIDESPDSIPVHRRLFRVTIPHFNSTFRYAEYPKDAGGPKYPTKAELARVGDTVNVSFTIMSDGTVSPQSVDVLKGHYRDFIRAVFDKLATTHYVPAYIARCAVASHAQQSFVFRMRD
jgi:hypothetical protein